MRKLTVGILAHVDAGKTTLSEALLYRSGGLKKLGRVDHRDAFLDTDELERERGITIFSKQAVFRLGELEVTLMDTPGHADFSSEMERTLQVLDYAVLVISGTDGVQGHTQVLWRLLERYGIPTFLFINKMDLAGADRALLLAELKRLLNEGCVDFGDRGEAFQENVAVCDETVLADYLETGVVSNEAIVSLTARRRLFPCYFGSALRLDGVDEFLDGFAAYTRSIEYPKEFGAKVYKILRDQQGNRLTCMKITGGSLRVKDLLTNRRATGPGAAAAARAAGGTPAAKAGKIPVAGNTPEAESTSAGGVPAADGGDVLAEDTIWEEKANQIRIYSGTKYRTVDEAPAGTVCAVAGLSRTHPGEGLGMEQLSEPPLLEPVLTYQVILPEGCDPHSAIRKLKLLEDEDPQLHLVWNEQLRELHIQLMGEVQLEILKRLIADRFDLSVEFGTGSIVYRETIKAPVEGIGHFEPLRHYAEVHLLLEPGERGSGLRFETACSEDVLDRNWQRLVLTHLEEREHPGVLTGSPITDIKITLVAGRAHEKHTEGGDFRQATYRAVRQGLMSAECVLLEPWYDFRLEVPSENVGRAMADIQRMSGTVSQPETLGDETVLTGSAPVAGLRDYARETASYTKGRGRLFCTLKGYEQCHDQEDVIERIGYESERDTENPSDSVFCSHGEGFVVKWNEVREHMHVDSGLRLDDPQAEAEAEVNSALRRGSVSAAYSGSREQDKELQAIFERTYGAVRRRDAFQQKQQTSGGGGGQALEKRTIPHEEMGPEYLLVDGYNVIFAWDELKELAKINLDAARECLLDILCNYQGFRRCIVIAVFDAYKVPHGTGEKSMYHNIHVVYTKEAETADAYIERVTYEIGRHSRVRVVTSDGMVQLIILGHGALRVSARDFRGEVGQVEEQIAAILARNNKQQKTRALGEALGKALEESEKKM